MVRRLLARSVKASERPAVWRSVAAGCRVARALAPRRRRWTARLGYAYYHLGRCLRKQGDLHGAAAALRTACELEDGNAQWLGQLGDLEWRTERLSAAAAAYERVLQLRRDGRPVGAGVPAKLADVQELRGEAAEQSGDRPAAVAAYERVLQLRGDDVRVRLRLATIHDQVGQWDVAQRLLRENTERHPRHGDSLRLLAVTANKIAQWGGTFTGTLPARAGGRFRFGPLPGAGPADGADQEPTALARAALERAAELAPPKPSARVALAEARLADGDPQGAIAQYEEALDAAERSDGRWVLGVKHRWQFGLESVYHQLGQPRVEDPLFACRVHSDAGTLTGTHATAGLFVARIGFAGLGVAGSVLPEGCDQVEILLDGVPLRAVRLSYDGFFPRFSLTIKRSTLELFPEHGQIEVRLPGGDRLHGPGGTRTLHVAVPHGNGRLLDAIANSGGLDKKGTVSPSPAETRRRQQRYLETYSRVRDFFEQELGRPVFLMYGTLLGCYRDGDLIPDDDDFDAGYVSDRTDPLAVKEETQHVIVALVRAGFTVSFNRQGRLFRVQTDRASPDGCHVDLRPIWFQDGRAWAHNNACFPATRADFLPVEEGKLRDVRVSMPRHTETFLQAQYGPGWKVPDPGFRYYPQDLDPAVRDNLARGLITVAEYKALAERIRREVGDSPDAGRLVSIGSQDLYPVDQFID